ncbi:Flp family type IVb pilin [Sphingopyxis sp.]|uniref:Flp family type IVb pilin n=1 Tax=Sphingopyxis sp. TaxID=1908224 RepID=UPI0034576A0A
MGILGNYISVRGGTMRNLYRLMRSTRAATAVEYGLILALIFLAAMSTITNVGRSTSNMWTGVSSAATNAM